MGMGQLELLINNGEERNIRYVVAAEENTIIVYEKLDDEIEVYTLSIPELELVLSLAKHYNTLIA